jgi:hypothetical protein
MTLEQLVTGREILFYPRDSLPRAPIYLIGTIHRSSERAIVLEELLRNLEPALISVEISPYSWRVRKKYQDLWLKRFDQLVQRLKLRLDHPAIRLYREALKMPYELEVTQKVARERRIPLVPVDSSRVARRLLRELISGLNSKNLCLLAKAPPVTCRENEEALVRFLLRTGLWPRRTKEDQAREEKILRLLKRLANKKTPLVHIGGWRHLPGLLQGLPSAIGIFLSNHTEI